MYAQFSAAVKETRDYYDRYPDLDVERPEDMINKLCPYDDDVLAMFTGEEGFGRFLDLHELYSEYINLPHNKDIAQAMDYVTYLQTFFVFDGANINKTALYRQYLEHLDTYLRSWLTRAKPLFNKEEHYASTTKEFEKKWAESGARYLFTTAEEEARTKEFTEAVTKKAPIVASTQPKKTAMDDIDGLDGIDGLDAIDGAPTTEVNLSSYSNATQLEALGMEALKAELQRRGLKCGGNLQQRALRLWEEGTGQKKPAPASQPKVKKEPEEVSAATGAATATNNGGATGGGKKRNKKKRGKRASDAGATTSTTATTKDTPQKAIARLQFSIFKTAEILEDEIDNTKLNIEKKQSRTHDMILQEEEEEEGSDVEVEEEEEDVVIGKQNYPVGWDGKPIPYWLYKLHGLGIEYSCEICESKYMGRRAFERHFQEWKHAYAMRMLEIPNTRHFAEVTKVQEAKELWEKIKTDSKYREWRPDDEMEFEDKEGNVLTKKTYDDLAKQGILNH
eukprot:TRINITY_DN3608_c0_g1_i1.p1 TRINITY_DN3608_c0_g1~~TRINITY_DN3608_c0_g1_i1.p1  ORF type:complete len:506 (-),score=126.50 TRINITY_DN3608_c0_g1_i1:75-1592(-)